MRAILVSVPMVFGLVATANAQFSGGASGPGIPPTNIELQQRCDDGQSAACDTLGLRFYKGGKGSEGDLKKSAALFQRACDGRDAFGCSNLARNYLYGRGVKQDFARAVRLAETGCKGDVDTGCFIVGLAYHDGIAGYPKDRNRAISYYRQACGDGKKFDHACEVLAEMGASRTVPKVVAQAPPAPDPKAAALAANEAGVAAYNRRDFASSASQFSIACNGGLAMGCYNLGMRLWNGEGVSQNKNLALQQLNKGCAGGVALACTQVTAANQPPPRIIQANAAQIRFMNDFLIRDSRYWISSKYDVGSVRNVTINYNSNNTKNYLIRAEFTLDRGTNWWITAEMNGDTIKCVVSKNSNQGCRAPYTPENQVPGFFDLLIKDLWRSSPGSQQSGGCRADGVPCQGERYDSNGNITRN